MSDEADMAAGLEALHLARSLSRIDPAILAGVSGVCAGCDEHRLRLVRGLCGYCRDGRLPPEAAQQKIRS